MGWAITWCAVREEKADQFLNQLGLSRTGETEELPESLISTASLDTGWRVVWYNKYDCPFLRPRDLPESFPAIRNDMEQAQVDAGGDHAGVDYIFEIPLKLAEALVGFKHDKDNTHVIDGHYVVLSRTDPAGGILRRLFRK